MTRHRLNSLFFFRSVFFCFLFASLLFFSACRSSVGNNGEEDCIDGDSQITPTRCGINNNGQVREVCEDGVWVIDGCEDDDVCVSGTIKDQTEPCGLNDRGTITTTCVYGKWEKGDCADPDICKDGNKSICGCYQFFSGTYLGERTITCTEGQNETSACEVINYKSDMNTWGRLECKNGFCFLNDVLYTELKQCWDIAPEGTSGNLAEGECGCGDLQLHCGTTTALPILCPDEDVITDYDQSTPDTVNDADQQDPDEIPDEDSVLIIDEDMAPHPPGPCEQQYPVMLADTGREVDFTVSDPAGNGEFVVTDSLTGLVWQQIFQSLLPILHVEEAVSFCEELVYANESDWRTPTPHEVMSIVDYGSDYPSFYPALLGESFVYDYATDLWTPCVSEGEILSSQMLGCAKYYFPPDLGGIQGIPGSPTGYVVCVRAGNVGTFSGARFIVEEKVSGQPTVFDQLTKRRWVKTIVKNVACTQLNYGSYFDWGGPGLNELRSLANFGSWPVSFFPDMDEGYYRTDLRGMKDYYWHIEYQGGSPNVGINEYGAIYGTKCLR